MPAEYLDLAHITAKSAQESAGAGWGLVVSASPPVPSGYIPSLYNQRGQTLAGLVQQLGQEGRANGVRVTYQQGVAQVQVGLPAWELYEHVLIEPFNCRQEGQVGGGRSLAAVTVEAGGDQATAYNAGARFPGRELVTGSDGSAGYLAEARINSASRVRGGLILRVSSARSDLRVGHVVLFVGRSGTAVYLRVTSIVADDADLPTEFRLSGQIVEPDALSPVALTRGAYWPGTRGTGGALVRQVRGRS